MTIIFVFFVQLYIWFFLLFWSKFPLEKYDIIVIKYTLSRHFCMKWLISKQFFFFRKNWMHAFKILHHGGRILPLSFIVLSYTLKDVKFFSTTKNTVHNISFCSVTSNYLHVYTINVNTETKISFHHECYLKFHKLIYF